MDVMNREQTLEFLSHHVKTEMLMKHLFSVEASMRGYARKFQEDEDRWAIAGLLHDFDWEICPTPEDHPNFGAEILREHGYPDDIIRAVLTHGDHTGIPRESSMEQPCSPLTSCPALSGPWPWSDLPRAWATYPPVRYGER